MIRNSIGIVVCRVGAVLLFVQALQGGVTIFTNFALYPEISGQMSPVFVSLSIMIAGPAIAGILLWIYAESICEVPGTPPEHSLDKALGRRELVAIGTYLIGIYAVVFGIVHALEWESYFQIGPAILPEFEGFTDGSGARAVSKRIAYSGQIVLGVVLIILAKRR